MKISSILCGALLTLSASSFAQHQGDNWQFGNSAGIHFDFTSHAPSAISSSYIGSYTSGASDEGVASISDNLGNLLFYTDGQTIYNSTGSVMTNGTGLMGNSSSTQSGIIVPKPGSSSQYFVFTVDAFSQANKIKYNIVDIATGEVVSGKKNLTMPYATGFTEPAAFTEKITAIPKASGIGFWLLAHCSMETGTSPGTFIVWSLDCSGSTDGISEILANGQRQQIGSACTSDGTSSGSNPSYAYELGYMKISPDKSKLAYASSGANTVEIFDFNNATGILSNVKKATSTSIGAGQFPYGLEFSPDGHYLYVTALYGTDIKRYDLNIAGSYPSLETSSSEYTSYSVTPTESQNGGWDNYTLGALQYAPDGKIYCALPGRNHLLTITNPNNASPTITENGFTLSTDGSKYSTLGLPNFVTTFLGQASITITGDPCHYQLSYTGSSNLPNATYSWNFGDGGTSTEQSPTHGFNASGTFTVTLTVTDNVSGCSATAQQEVNVLSCPCQAAYDSHYQKFTTNTTISSSTVWDDKIYIADNVIITVDNNAILDITNVDVVFGRGAGIDFKNGAILRANNSVFRPCDMNDVWRGLKFFRSNNYAPIGTINECTFKNAKTAIEAYDLYSKMSLDLRLTDNLFADCQRGISFYNVTSLNSITGNTYMLNNQNLPFNTVSSYFNYMNTLEYYGIKSDLSDYVQAISQNDFIFAANTTATGGRPFGIYLNYGNNIEISDNKFTDFVLGVYGNYNTNLAVEHNSFSLTNLFNMASAPGNKVQVLINYAENLLIKDNEIYNSNIMNSTSSSFPNLTLANIGISSNASQHVVVAGNKITGCELGMSFKGGLSKPNQDLFVSENEIKKSWFYGIYIAGYINTDISCNTIDMELNSTREATGISYNNINLATYGTSYMGSANVGIRSNCILNTKNGIYCYNQNSGTSTPLPKIYNNFIYNYLQKGFENNGFTEGAGSPYEVYHNTFMSNNSGSGIGDVVTDASHAIHPQSNYGIQNGSSNVTPLYSNTEESTAACAMQTGMFNNNLSEYNGAQLCGFYFTTATSWSPTTKLIPTNATVIPSTSTDEDYTGTIYEDPMHTSGTAMVNFKDEMFVLHPNPAKDIVKIHYNVELANNATIEVIDVQGRVLKSINASFDMNDISVDVSELPSGVYIVRMMNDSKAVYHSKLIKS